MSTLPRPARRLRISWPDYGRVGPRPVPASARLQVVNKEIVEKQGQEVARASAQQSRYELRRDLRGTSELSLNLILETLRERVAEMASSEIVSKSPGLRIDLGAGTLAVDPPRSAPAGCLAAFDYEPPFDVIADSEITARMQRVRRGYEGRSQSSWFCDAHDEDIFRWY